MTSSPQFEEDQWLCNAGEKSGHWVWPNARQLTDEGHKEAGSHASAYSVHQEIKSSGDSLFICVPAEGVLRLGHADWQLAEAQLVIPLDILICFP